MCYYFCDIIKIEDFNVDNILIDENLSKIVYNISYKTLIYVKPLCIRFNKIDGFIRIYDTRYLVLFGREKYDFIYNRIKNGIMLLFLKSIQKSKIHTFLYL